MFYLSQFDLVVIWFDRGIFVGALFYFYLTTGRHKLTGALDIMET